MNRRDLFSAGMAAGASAALTNLAPVKALAADVKPVRIKTIETFNIEIPATPTEIEAGVMNRINVTRVMTESGVRGYSFGGAGDGGRIPARPGSTARPAAAGGRGLGANTASFQKIRDALIGSDLFAVNSI